MASEQEIQKQIMDWLKENDIWHRRIPVGAVKHAGVRKRSSLKGMPDIMGILPKSHGKAFFIEVKTDEGRLSEGQKLVIDELKEAGALVIIARRLSDVEAYFKFR